MRARYVQPTPAAEKDPSDESIQPFRLQPLPLLALHLVEDARTDD